VQSSKQAGFQAGGQFATRRSWRDESKRGSADSYIVGAAIGSVLDNRPQYDATAGMPKRKRVTTTGLLGRPVIFGLVGTRLQLLRELEQFSPGRRHMIIGCPDARVRCLSSKLSAELRLRAEKFLSRCQDDARIAACVPGRLIAQGYKSGQSLS
jgi:hypothetical protein